MYKSQLLYLMYNFGSASLPREERWKNLKYIGMESQIAPIRDFQIAFKEGTAAFADDPSIGAGFYIFDIGSTDHNIIQSDKAEITYIPIESCVYASIVATEDGVGDGVDNEYMPDTYDEPMFNALEDQDDALAEQNEIVDLYQIIFEIPETT